MVEWLECEEECWRLRIVRIHPKSGGYLERTSDNEFTAWGREGKYGSEKDASALARRFLRYVSQDR